MSNKVFVKYRDKCLICKIKVEDKFWIYLWKGKQGFCCDVCGREIHKAGYKILEIISDILSKNGATNIYHKEKFGYYQFDATVDTPKQMRLAEALFNQAREDFPEFSFSFHAWLKKTNLVVH